MNDLGILGMLGRPPQQIERRGKGGAPRACREEHSMDRCRCVDQNELPLKRCRATAGCSSGGVAATLAGAALHCATMISGLQKGPEKRCRAKIVEKCRKTF